MNKYKITTSWTGYSEIEVEAKSEKEAKAVVDMETTILTTKF